MRKLLIALLVLACLPAFAGEAKIKHNIERAKYELWGKFDKYPSVFGVGEGMDKESHDILIIYMDCSDVKLFQRIPNKFKGIKVEAVCTTAFKANEEMK